MRRRLWCFHFGEPLTRELNATRRWRRQRRWHSETNEGQVKLLIKPTSNQASVYLPLFSTRFQCISAFPEHRGVQLQVRLPLAASWARCSVVEEGRVLPRLIDQVNPLVRDFCTFAVSNSEDFSPRPPSPRTSSLSALLLRLVYLSIYTSSSAAILSAKLGKSSGSVPPSGRNWIGKVDEPDRLGDRYFDDRFWVYVAYVRRANSWNATFIVGLRVARAAPLSNPATSFFSRRRERVLIRKLSIATSPRLMH